MPQKAEIQNSSNDIDVIIVNFNASDYLNNCLRSVYNNLNGFSADVFVADNGSVDQPQKVLQRFPRTHVIFNPKNLGFSKAVNQLIAKSSSPYVMLLNPDTIVGDFSFNQLVDFMKEHPEVAIVGPRVLNQDGSVQGSARSFPTLLTGLFGRTSILSKIFPNNRFTRGNILTHSRNEKSPVEVGWVSGACMMVRREAIEDVGSMDEQFFMYWEDADWCRRMSQKGWKIIYLPTASVTHHVGGSSRKRPIRSCLEFHKSSYRIYMKYSNWPFKAVFKPIALSLLGTRFIVMSLLHYTKYLASCTEEMITSFKDSYSNKSSNPEKVE